MLVVVPASGKTHILTALGSPARCGRTVDGRVADVDTVTDEFCKVCAISYNDELPAETQAHLEWAIREMEPVAQRLAGEMAIMQARVSMPGITPVMADDLEMASRVIALDPAVSMATVRRSIRHHGRVTHIRNLRRRFKKEQAQELTHA